MIKLKYVPSIDKNFQPNLVVLEDFETSRGCNVEIGYCKARGIPIVYLNDMI